MTREEAVSWLKSMKDTIELYNDLSHSQTFDKFPQAIDMAISALSNTQNCVNTQNGDLISRTEALDQMAQAECGLHYEDCEADNCSCSYISRILDLPSVSAERSGEWIHCHNVDRHMDEYECTNCHDCNWYPSNFCPNCGARMEDEK